MIDISTYYQQILIFITSELLGMLYAYCWKWVELKEKISLFSYLFGDSKETLKVILVFTSTVVGTVGLDYLNSLNTFQTILAGCGIGLLIPQKVNEKEKRIENGKTGT